MSALNADAWRKLPLEPYIELSSTVFLTKRLRSVDCYLNGQQITLYAESS